MIYKIECLYGGNIRDINRLEVIDCILFKFRNMDYSNRAQVIRYGISKAVGTSEYYINDKYVGQSAYYQYYKTALIKYLRDKKIDEINGI